MDTPTNHTMISPTDHVSTSEGSGTQPGGIASQTLTTEQSSEGPISSGGITGSVRSRGVKRKLAVQTYETKYQATLEVERGTKKKDVALKFGIPANTLSTWLKKKDEIKNKFIEADIGPKCKRDKKAKFPELEDALIQWFSNARSKNVPISGDILREKAKQFAEQLNVSNFECSTGWLERFKERRKLSFKKVCGESNAVDSNSNAITDWNVKLQTLLREYPPNNVYNADETGLFFRMLPNKNLEFKDVQCHGGKMSKDRLTVMVCANMTGSDKMPLLVIGKSKNPRCFKNVKTMPVEYDANKKAWVTSEIFTNWVKKIDRRATAQGRRLVLIIDNCPAHPDIVGLKSVKLVFLPPNTTSLTQPMDQGVIRNLKAHYRKFVIQRQLRAIETGSETSITVLDALYMLKCAWRAVTDTTISNCFRHAGFEQPPATNAEASEDDPEDDIPLAALRRLASGVTFEQYTSADDNVPVCADLTDTEIISNVISQREAQPEDCEDEDLPSRPHVTIHDVMNGLDTLRDYLHQQGIGNQAETDKAIGQISDLSAMFSRFYLRRSDCKQTTIADFFGKSDCDRL